MLGNSSSGIREAPVYAKYAINLGARQYGRYRLSRDFIIDSIEDKEAILSAIRKAKKMPKKSQFYIGARVARRMHL